VPNEDTVQQPDRSSFPVPAPRLRRAALGAPCRFCPASAVGPAAGGAYQGRSTAAARPGSGFNSRRAAQAILRRIRPRFCVRCGVKVTTRAKAQAPEVRT